MSKLNLFIQSQIVDNSNISQERLIYNEGQLTTNSHLHGEVTVAAGVTKSLFSGTSKYVFIQSDKEVELDFDGEKLTISPMFQGIYQVDAIFSANCKALDISVKNTSTQTATVKFLFVE
jgi:hypothetical protein